MSSTNKLTSVKQNVFTKPYETGFFNDLPLAVTRTIRDLVSDNHTSLSPYKANLIQLHIGIRQKEGIQIDVWQT